MSAKSFFLYHPNLYIHLTKNSLFGICLIAFALNIGMLGYHFFESMPWIDSFLNASMILSGMGPANPMITTGGKIFAGCYALFSGLAFIAIIVMMLSPIIHRFFKKIHISTDDNT
jgi:hypothetical protein